MLRRMRGRSQVATELNATRIRCLGDELRSIYGEVAAMSEPKKILLTGNISEQRLQELRTIASSAVLQYLGSNDEIEDAVEDAAVVAGHVSPGALGRAMKLEWVHSWAAGPNTQLFPEFARSSVMLTCSKGNGAIPLAEHAMMLMLMLNRGALRWIDAQRAHSWSPFVHGELNGLTCAILGTGNSGKDLAAKAKAFHMTTIGLHRSARPTENFDRIYPREQLEEFLSAADFLVVTVPNTPETRNMLGETQLRLMKKDAYFVCCSRGGIADDAALYKALRERWIAGAGLDAHAVEPLPEDSPFWTLDNVIITPHNGATTPATKRRGYEIFRDNLRRWVAGEPLCNVVDKQAGY